MLQHLVTPLMARSEPPSDLSDVPKWLWGAFVADFILLVPICFFISYTVGTLFPILAIVEDEKATSDYQILSSGGDEANAAAADAEGTRSLDPALFTVNASLRRLHKLLRSSGGFRTYFRGILCLIVMAFAASILRPIVTSILPLPALQPLAQFIINLLLAQLHTTWVHVIIAPKSDTHFYRRLPPFRKAIEANLRPTALLAALILVAQAVPALIAKLASVPYPVDWAGGPDQDFLEEPRYTVGLGLLLLLNVVLALVFVVPAYVALVRVQASLLPPDHDPIVAFDRSFGGRVSPAVVTAEGERDYATLRDVWETLTKDTVRRLAIVIFKVFGVQVAFFGVVAAVLGPQIAKFRSAL